MALPREIVMGFGSRRAALVAAVFAIAAARPLGTSAAVYAGDPGGRAPEEAGSRRFHGEAAGVQKRAKELTDALRLDGIGVFLVRTGFSQAYRGDELAAKKTFARLIERDPDNEDGYLHLADSFMISRDYAAAAALYSEAMARSPRSRPYYLARRSRAYLEARMFSEALADADAALKVPGPPSFVKVVRVRALLGLGRVDAAAGEYARYLKGRRRELDMEEAGVCESFAYFERRVEGCAR